MNREVILLHRIENFYPLSVFRLDVSGVAYLSAHLAVERSAVEHELNHLPVLLFHCPVAREPCPVNLREIVAEELYVVAVVELNPVAELVRRGVAGPVLLFLELNLKPFEVDGISLFRRDELAQVNREPEGVIERESVLSRDDLCVGAFLHNAVNQPDAPVESAEESKFLFLDDLLDESLLEGDFRIMLSHVAH